MLVDSLQKQEGQEAQRRWGKDPALPHRARVDVSPVGPRTFLTIEMMQSLETPSASARSRLFCRTMNTEGRNRPERRLAAILAADVAGYSRLIGADEEGTLNRLRSVRAEVIDPKITEHRGRIV